MKLVKTIKVAKLRYKYYSCKHIWLNLVVDGNEF